MKLYALALMFVLKLHFPLDQSFAELLKISSRWVLSIDIVLLFFYTGRFKEINLDRDGDCKYPNKFKFHNYYIRQLTMT